MEQTSHHSDSPRRECGETPSVGTGGGSAVRVRLTSRPPGALMPLVTDTLPTSQGAETLQSDIESIVQAVCVLIGEKGHSMRSACAKMQVNRITVERWVAKSERLTCAVECARSQFRELLMKRALECTTKWDSPDPNVTMFLLERTQREEFAPIPKSVEHVHIVSLPAPFVALVEAQIMAENGQKEGQNCPIPAIPMRCDVKRLAERSYPH